MISYFAPNEKLAYVVEHNKPFSKEDEQKLLWLFECNPTSKATPLLEGKFAGPRSEMISPWSTNAVEIASDMHIDGITRIELLRAINNNSEDYDPMLEALYLSPKENIFATSSSVNPEPIKTISNIEEYNKTEGLALNDEEIHYLKSLAEKLQRPLTDSEIFGFSQVNSEHCRHKIFNGTFILNGQEQPASLFQLIKQTSKENPNTIVSAYSDNVAFLKGPKMLQFAPQQADKPSSFSEKEITSVISLKAETHNFPTTVEPFNGAATGTGGEIRDRMAGGKGSIPMAGTAVYMTSYPEGKQTNPNIRPKRGIGFTARPEKYLLKQVMVLVILGTNLVNQ